ncbi:putative skeletal organic matrix protein 5 isoform X2 [Oculina patagonica]
MYLSLKAWVCAVALIEVLFMFTVMGASSDSCETVIKSFDKRLKNVEADVKAIARALNVGNPPPGSSFTSCRDIYIYGKHSSPGNKAYLLQTNNGKIPVYCHMTSYGIGACGGGGWTLVMKTDGNKRTFHFDSHFWSDRNVYNIAGGKTGFDLQETKLPSYSNTTFSKICLGMKISQQINFIVINKQANSLYSLIADGQYRATSLGRNTWKTLIGSQSSLQRNYSKARIGFLGNDGSGCSHCDSRIGFGTGGLYDDSNTCGNEACCSPDNGDKHIKAMGYILEQ